MDAGLLQISDEHGYALISTCNAEHARLGALQQNVRLLFQKFSSGVARQVDA